MGRGKKKKQPSYLQPGGIPFYDDGTNWPLLYLQSALSRQGERELSCEEARWRHYLDTKGRTPSLANKTDAPTSESSPALTRTQLVPPSCLALHASATTAEGVSPTSTISSTTCSLCAPKVAIGERGIDDSSKAPPLVGGVDVHGARCGGDDDDVEGDDDEDDDDEDDDEDDLGATDGAADGSYHRRVRRLERTVESLSHGLVLALTQLNLNLNSNSNSGDVRATEPPHGRAPRAPNPPRRARHRARPNSSKVGDEEYSDAVDAFEAAAAASVAAAAGSSSDNAFGCTATATGNDDDDGDDESSLFTSKDRSPISGMLGPILKFVTSSDVSRFLKQAEESHAGLRSATQMFDLSWVLDNFFNIHGGILMHCLQEGLTTMNDISRSLAPDAWFHDPEFIRELDEAYLITLRPHIRTDGKYNANANANAAWKSYCLKLDLVFSERYPRWCSGRYFRDLSKNFKGCFNPVLTTSYIDDLTRLWTQVHPALLEVTRWLEPFIDYGPDFIRSTPFYDATIALGYRARELLSRKGAKEQQQHQQQSDVSSQRVVDSLLQFLRVHRSTTIAEMQLEMKSIMNGISRDFDASAFTSDDSGSLDPEPEEAVLVQRAKRATGWQQLQLLQRSSDGDGDGDNATEELRDQLALALYEVRVMRSYRPRLLRAGTAAAKVRDEIFHVLSDSGGGGGGGGVPLGQKDVFWDGIVLNFTVKAV